MKTHPACASCIIDDLRSALEITAPNETECLAILREAMAWLEQEFDQRHIPSFYITRLHRLLKQRTGLEVPFHTLRQQCNRAGLAVCEQVAQALMHIADKLERLRWLVSWAIAGNHLDFRTVGTGYHLAVDEITAQLATVIAEGLAIDHTPALLPLLYKDCRVLYLADNVGEIALDTLLVAELQRYGCQVVVAVKGGPITSDAIWEDAHSVGMDKLAPVILTGPDTLGLPLDEMSTDLRKELEGAQVIISKGQANYYACSELAQEYQGTFFCLLRTKCFVAAQSLGLDKTRANVAVLLPQGSS